MTSKQVAKGDPALHDTAGFSPELLQYIHSCQGKSLNFNDLRPELQRLGSVVKSILTAEDKVYLNNLARKYYVDDAVFEDPVVKVTNSADAMKYLYYTTALPYKGSHVAEHAVRLRMSDPYKSRYKYPELQQDIVMEIDFYTRYYLPKTNTPADWLYPPYIPFYLTVTLNIDPQSGKILKEKHSWLNIPVAVPNMLKWLTGATGVTGLKLAERIIGAPEGSREYSGAGVSTSY